MGDSAANRVNSVREFFGQLDRPDSLFDLFDPLPGIYLYVKDRKSRFVRVNHVVCEVVGAACPEDVVGKTDFDFFPPAIAAQYVMEDRRVIETERALTNQVWFVPGADGFPHLYLCSKIPLFNRSGTVIGIAGVKRPYEHSVTNLDGYNRLVSVLVYVADHYHDTVKISDIAEHVELSVSQLQREFSRCFGITPSNYLREVRVGMARHLLETSDDSLSVVADACGFFDQSHFTHHFKKATGLTPSRYRQQFRVR